MHLTYDHTHHCSPCDRGSPVTLGGPSEARHSLVIYNLLSKQEVPSSKHMTACRPIILKFSLCFALSGGGL